MFENQEIKRQTYFNGLVYDILGVIKLGNISYTIIGRNNGNTYYDIMFVERKLEDGKVVYVDSVSNYHMSAAKGDFTDLKGKTFMATIINDIRDGINGTNKDSGYSSESKVTLANSEDIINYVNKALQTIEGNEDIRAFFDNNSVYESEEQFDKSMDSVITYYHLQLNKTKDDMQIGMIPALGVDLDLGPKVEEVNTEEVNELYRKLEDTQNYGASLIPDSIKSYSEDYITDPTNNLFIETPEKKEPSIFVTNDNMETFSETSSFDNFGVVNESVAAEQLDVDSQNLSFQQQMYLENEKMLHGQTNGVVDHQMDTKAKTKTLSLYPNANRGGNAAYISMTLLLYLIGSFELLLTIILLAKNL